MVGLIALFALSIYIGVACFLINRIQNRKGKIIIALVFILIPAADVIVGEVYFRYLCSKYSGSYVYKKVGIGDEYYLEPGEEDNSRWIFKLEFLTKYNGQKINRGKIIEDFEFLLKAPEKYSRYFHIYKREKKITNKKTNAVLSKLVQYIYGGGWIENIGYFRGSGSRCPKRETSIETLAEKTFYQREIKK